MDLGLRLSQLLSRSTSIKRASGQKFGLAASDLWAENETNEEQPLPVQDVRRYCSLQSMCRQARGIP